jgi:hypothetical protein
MRRPPRNYVSSRAVRTRVARRIGVALSIVIASDVFVSNRGLADDACPDSSQPIATDRPSVTNSSLVVPTGSLQDENGINWTTSPGQGALDGPNTRLRLGVAHCSEFLVDLPDYNRRIYGSAPDGVSDVAPAFKHQFEALPEGTTASTIVGLGLPTGTHRVTGTGPVLTSSFHGPRQSQKVGAPTKCFQRIGSRTKPTVQTTFDIDRQIGEHADVFAE